MSEWEQTAAAGEMMRAFTLKVETEKPVETIASKVETECAEFKFALLKTYVYHEIVESKGFPINRKVFVYEICQAKTASMMLTTNPEFSIFMPCVFSVYEEKGKSVLATRNMEMMLSAVKENKELFEEASGLFNSIKLMLNKLAG